jgi:hypothetical protein
MSRDDTVAASGLPKSIALVARELIAKVAYKQDVYELGTWLEEQHNELRKYSVKPATLPLRACLTNSA